MRTRRKAEDSAKYVKVVGDVAYVQLRRLTVAVIDAIDAERVGRHLWSVAGGYAACGPSRRTCGKIVWLHRFILGYEGDLQVDHKDGDQLNNRRSNLRVCTHAENSRNRTVESERMGVEMKCEFKGVTAIKGRYYVANIQVAGKNHYLGSFATAKRAALAYDRAAKELHGEFARTNLESGEFL